MSLADLWMLPDGMDEMLPPQARQIETLRRQLLDLYHAWGYDLVLPPKVEFLESLLTGVGRDLDLQTFKLTDQVTGRMMGVSADVTPQVARMDAHSMAKEGIARFCYSTEILRTRADNLLGSRSPIQLGAELFGHAGVASDLEVVSLMTETLLQAGATDLCLDLGHVGIYRGLLKAAVLPDQVAEDLFDIFQHKRLGELDALLAPYASQPAVSLIRELGQLNGGLDVLDRADSLLALAPDDVLAALQDLRRLAERLKAAYPDVDVYLDLSELRGYHYHTGLVFAAYVPGLGQALAKGGRYDQIGKEFGRARPATGFSTDLKMLATLRPLETEEQEIWYAPQAMQADPQGLQLIRQLREQGHRVVVMLDHDKRPPSAKVIQKQGQRWLLS